MHTGPRKILGLRGASVGAGLVVMIVGAASGCDDDLRAVTLAPDATVGDAASGAGGQGAVVTCGGTKCEVPVGSGIERLKVCCTAQNTCGLQLPGVDACLPRDLPGTQVPAGCPPVAFKTPGGDTLRPCCGPDGCGGLDAFLGCVPRPHLGESAAACEYDPKNDCTNVLSIGCDGAEDCPGQRCCGRGEGAQYVEVGCFDSCLHFPDAGPTVFWRELCHAGDLCENTASNVSCLGSLTLPPPLAKCDSMGPAPVMDADHVAGHVNCGSAVCGAGQKCCLRPPHTPYCAAVDADCECNPPDAGGPVSSPTKDAAIDR